MMSDGQLRDRLQALQCHFTWDLDAPSQLKPEHVLQCLAVEIQHTPHHNQATLLALRAFLCQRLGRYADALQSLRDAEEQLRQDFPDGSPGQALLIYGNYAWVHYHLGTLDEATRYLERMQAAPLAPVSTALTAEISAQKGWSLLAVGLSHWQRARQCFEEALAQDPGSRELHAGLASALYAASIHSSDPGLKGEAMRQLEEVVQQQPENRRAKVFLACLLDQEEQQERVEALITAAVESCCDAEVLRIAAKLLQQHNLERSTRLLQQAVQEAPDYHLVHQTMGRSLTKQWYHAKGERKEQLLQAAISAMKEAVIRDPGSVFIKLQLAELYGERDPSWEEQIYLELEREALGFSLRCRQALCLSYGKFLMYKRRALQQAAKKLQDGYTIPIATPERMQCCQKLNKLIQWLNKSDPSKAKAIEHFIQEMDSVVAVQDAVGLQEEDE